MFHITLYTFFLIFLSTCQNEKTDLLSSSEVKVINNSGVLKIVPGAERLPQYYDLIKNKRVGLVVNQTSIVRGVHLVDSLIKAGIDIQLVFAPEHGFRGDADAGEKIKDEKDSKTGISIVSLYGNKKKPSVKELENIDLILFDIQDVGVRFYTYISTLHYVMEACAENDKPLVVLDRPNPNAHYIDGPVLKKEFSSFIGLHPIPVVYGMTIGEYAKMINGEKWLSNGVQCELTVIENKNYSHDSFYELPVRPSPNLPNARSVLLYPSLCFFEGTEVSVGRGTETQFQVFGHPSITSSYFFVPMPNHGAKSPLHQGEKCYGTDLTTKTIEELLNEKKLNLSYLIEMYSKINKTGKPFFLENLFFDKLAGTDSLRKMLMVKTTEKEIRASWKNELENFKKLRLKYLLYE
ncbi:MAG: DUF1343 domain-containing protein [Saprospiraceae bacterium]|nr:DUF1343 domain-containing protein [Saprospiraceae bacterium]